MDWDADRSVSDNIGQGNTGGVDSDVGVEVGSGGGEGVK